VKNFTLLGSQMHSPASRLSNVPLLRRSSNSQAATSRACKPPCRIAHYLREPNFSERSDDLGTLRPPLAKVRVMSSRRWQGMNLLEVALELTRACWGIVFCLLLVKTRLLRYCLAMSLKKYFAPLLMIFTAANLAFADTIQLKDKAAVTGKVLAEKSDALVVDIGYTVLVIPRKDVLSRIADAKVKTPLAAPPMAGVNTPQFYTANVPASPSHDVQDLVKQIGEAVVQVRTPEGLGSGFFINADGYLITNFHVIEGETEISVEVYHRTDGQLQRDVYKQVRIIAINKFHDLALLHIEDKNAPKFKYVSLGSSDALTVGDPVFAIGSPLGLERTVTQGIISTKTRELEGELYLQTTAQINPGNSGGPLFNMAGEVVGVTNMKIIFGEGLGFAIPVELVKNFLDHRDAFAYSTDNPNNPYRYLDPPAMAAHLPAKGK
jgi:serine protease Do